MATRCCSREQRGGDRPGTHLLSTIDGRIITAVSGKAGRPMFEVIAEICGLVEGPVSAEAVAADAPTMLAETMAVHRPNVPVITKEALRREAGGKCANPGCPCT